MPGILRLLFTVLVAGCLLAAAAPASAFVRSGPVELGSAINDGAFSWGEPHVYRSTFLANHQAATHEHSMKMLAVQPQRGRWDFAMADAIANWTVNNGKKLHGHTLVWCRDEWNPSWVTERAWTRAELLAIMTEHIRTVVGRYRGRAASWDVVNEAFTAAGGREPCVWERYIGPDWIEQAFRAAAEADPNALLFYNEWNADVPNARFGAMEAMAKDFLARGVPLHGIGMQHHTYGIQPVQDRVEEAMARVAALGLAVHVSEMDVPMASFAGTTEQKLAQQEQAYATVAAACHAQPACMRFTTWGFVDGIGWRAASELSAPFDADYQPKPAWRAIQRTLRPPPAPASNRAPGAPGRPAPSAPVAAKNLTVSWTPAADADRNALTYTLEHRDADDAAWTSVATGIRGTSYSFDGGRLERQGTLTYRVRADDGFVSGAWSATSAMATVDRSAPYAPTPTASRAADWASPDGSWFRDSVTVQFRDGGDQTLPDGSPGAGVDPASVPSDVTYAAAGTHSATGTVTDRAGNVSAPRTRSFSVDVAAPSVAASATAGGAAYAGTWTRSDVTVTWTCSDQGAGVDTVTPPTTVTSEGALQRRTGTCRDRVGHVASADSAPISIDRTGPAAPAITPARAPEDATGGWFADRVEMRFAAAGDAFADGTEGSGVDPASVPPPVTLTSTTTVAGRVRDHAGNLSGEAARLVRVDAAAPEVRLSCPATVERGAEARGTWTASDGQSGLATPAEGTVALDTATDGSHTRSVEARDRVGHVAAASCTYTVTAPASAEDEVIAEPPPPPPSPPADPEPDPEPAPQPAPEPEPEPQPRSEPAPAPAPSDTGAEQPTSEPPVFTPAPPATTESRREPAPAVRVRTRRARVRDGAIRLRITCESAAPAPCAQRLALRRSERTLARTKPLRLQPGATATATLRLSSAARAQLRRRGRLTVTIVADGRKLAPVVLLRR